MIFFGPKTLYKTIIFRNCKVAFSVAEEELGIPRLLDVEDVINYHSPDHLSILTYISQFYYEFSKPEPDSGISSLSQSPASSDSDAESSILRRGAVLSLMDGRRPRSVSCHARRRVMSEGGRPFSPSIEQENPFIKEFQNRERIETSPGKSLAVLIKRVNATKGLPLTTHVRKEDESAHSDERMVQSMCVESIKEFSPNDCLKIISSNSRSFIPTTAKPTPYKSVETPNQDSILSKTQALLQDRRKRSKSQPPEKRLKQSFEFLSTNKYLVLHTNKVIKK